MPAKMAVPTTVQNLYYPAAGSKPKYTKIEKLKQKYDSYAMAAAEVPCSTSKKSKVKQIISMFDAQIPHNTDGEKCYNLAKAKQETKPCLSSTQNLAELYLNKESAPIPSPRTSLSTPQESAKSNFIGEQAPIPNSRTNLSNTQVAWATLNLNMKQAPTPTPRARTNLSSTEEWLAKSHFNEDQPVMTRSSIIPRAITYEAAPSKFNKEVAPVPTPRTSLSTTHNQAKSNFNKEPAPTPRCSTKHKPQAPQNSNTYFVSEDEFAKMSVKHKVQLYSQFINEISEKKPKFVKHSELVETNAKTTELESGEVVSEKQASVKYLLAKLEASCGLSTKKVSSLPPQSTRTTPQDNEKVQIPGKSTEFGNLLQIPPTYRSTLTIMLQKSCDIDVHKERSKSLTQNKNNKNIDDFKAAKVLEPAQKRSNEEMRYCFPYEVYAPPKKIRRTQTERLRPNIFFQSQQLKDLFFTWLSMRELKEKEANEKGEPEMTSKSPVEQQHIVEGMPKLGRQRKDQLTLPIPTVLSQPNKAQLSPISSDSHSANNESESGLSLLEKITSTDSLADNPAVRSDNDCELGKSPKPLRKKKLRRTLTWPKSKPVPATTPTTNSTDSDTDIRLLETKAKMLFLEPPTVQQSNERETPSQASSEELDRELLRDVNSPRKIKSAYTLTVYTPSPTQEEEREIYPKRAGHSTSSSGEKQNKFNAENSSSSSQKAKEYFDKTSSPEQKTRSLNRVSFSDVPDMTANKCDSFIDQGFETGSNMDMESPVRVANSLTHKNQYNRYRNTMFTSGPVTSNKMGTSPVRFNTYKRRKSISDNEGRHSSMSMQAIREDQPLDQSQIPPRPSFSATYASDMPADLCSLPLKQSSQFWIKCDYFCLSFDIFYHDTNRLRMLFNIFSQKSYDNRDLFFGIDKFIFSVYGQEINSKRLPSKTKYSHYWVSTGDLVLPFAGKRVTSAKTQHIFEFLKTSLEDRGGVIRFGVDGVEFSNVRELWNQSPKYSMESNYSMLVGLQSGSSNGLEGRSKYAWPHAKPPKHTEVPTCQEIYSGRSSSLSSFNDNKCEFFTSSPNETHSKQTQTGSKVLGSASNSNSYREKYTVTNKSPQPLDDASAEAAFNHIKCQQKHISSIQKKLSAYNYNKAHVSCDSLDALKGTPEYFELLKSIVTKIVNKGEGDGFQNCSPQQLQIYMFFLSHYAETCLHNCTDHIEAVLQALLDHRAVMV